MLKKKKYPFVLILTLTVILALILSLNIFVDPFRLMPWNMNEKIKVLGLSDERSLKTGLILSQRPDIVIIGSSRILRGIDPKLLDFEYSQNFKILNAGVAGLNPNEALYLMDHSIKRGAKIILVGLDFLFFLNHEKPRPLSSEFTRITESSNLVSYSNALLFYGLSQYVTKLSLNEVLNLSTEQNRTYHLNGYAYVNEKGTFKSRIKHNYEKDILLFKKKKVNEFFYESLCKMSKIGKEKNVKVIFFINPKHSIYFDSIKAAGLVSEYNNWLKNISKIIYGRTSCSDNLDNLVVTFDGRLRDFDTAIEFKDSNWWFEAHHYKPSLGKIIIGDIFSLLNSNNTSLKYGIHLEKY